MNTNLLKKLCDITAPSGHEEVVCDYIKQLLDEKNISYTEDSLNNLYVKIKGSCSDKTLMVTAHTDEVGMIVTDINSKGLISFSTVGGIDKRIFLGKKVVSEKGVVGVIGTKPIHLQSGDEKKSSPSADKLYIDIGAKNKEDTETQVTLGEYFCFEPDYQEFGDERIISKAIDDRIGCAIMLEILFENITPYYDTVFVFASGEEIGHRGATVAAYTVNPQIAIVLEATTAGDICDAPENKKMCYQGKGAVISFMDRGTIYDRDLYTAAFKIAEQNDILLQPKRGVAGGNDSAAIHKSRDGVRTLAVSVPCRYLHSPACVIKKSDLISQYEITKKLICYPL